jgi:hypothetical protein
MLDEMWDRIECELGTVAGRKSLDEQLTGSHLKAMSIVASAAKVSPGAVPVILQSWVALYIERTIGFDNLDPQKVPAAPKYMVVDHDGEVTEGNADVPDAVTWAARFLVTRIRGDQDGIDALYREAMDAPEFEDKVCALLRIVAGGIHAHRLGLDVGSLTGAATVPEQSAGDQG